MNPIAIDPLAAFLNWAESRGEGGYKRALSNLRAQYGPESVKSILERREQFKKEGTPEHLSDAEVMLASLMRA